CAEGYPRLDQRHLSRRGRRYHPQRDGGPRRVTTASQAARSLPLEQDLLQFLAERFAGRDRRLEAGLVQRVQFHVAQGRHRRVARCARQQGRLAEELPFAQRRQLLLVGPALVDDHVHHAALEEIELVALLALPDDHRSGRVALLLHLLG